MAIGQGNRWNLRGEFDVFKVTYKGLERREKLITSFVGNARLEQGTRDKPVYYYPDGQSGIKSAIDNGMIEHYWYRLVQES